MLFYAEWQSIDRKQRSSHRRSSTTASSGAVSLLLAALALLATRATVSGQEDSQGFERLPILADGGDEVLMMAHRRSRLTDHKTSKTSHCRRRVPGKPALPAGTHYRRRLPAQQLFCARFRFSSCNLKRYDHFTDLHGR
uniref:Uncharacterized protein n=1 Tax=Anopheles coluzzii TaxID=1518534 RepID=A0A8W7PF76_ANOCL